MGGRDVRDHSIKCKDREHIGMWGKRTTGRAGRRTGQGGGKLRKKTSVVENGRKRGRPGGQRASGQIKANKWQEYRKEPTKGAAEGMRELMKDRAGSARGSSFQGVGMRERAAGELGRQVGGVTKDSRDNGLKQKVSEKEDGCMQKERVRARSKKGGGCRPVDAAASTQVDGMYSSISLTLELQ